MAAQHPSNEAATLYIPDPLLDWPWQRRQNIFYEQAKSASIAWVSSYRPFSPQAQRKFDKCDFGLLAALAWPDHDAGQLRLACDLIQFFFVFDDHSDIADEDGVKRMSSCVMDALKDAHVSHGCVVGEMASDLWTRLKTSMPNPTYQRRFVDAFQRYTDAVVQEARDRGRACIRDVATYFPLRRGTIGTFPCWVFIYMGMKLPEDVFIHPTIVELETYATDLVIICNDMHSYNVEQAREDDGHNLVGIVRRQYGLSVNEAMSWVNEYAKASTTGFVQARMKLPSFGGEVDLDLARYADGLGNWVRANDSWDFEGQRYFGSGGKEIQRTRKVELLASSADSTIHVSCKIP